MTESKRSGAPDLSRFALALASLVVACAVDDRQVGYSPLEGGGGNAGDGSMPGGGSAGDAPTPPLGGTAGSGGTNPEGPPKVAGGLDAGNAGAIDAAVWDAGCDACAVGECEPGAALCASGTDRVECTADGLWGSPVACDYVCLGDTCGGECEPGATECLSSTGYRQCSELGAWSQALECDNACVGSVCAGECVPGAQRCVSTTEVQVCSDAGEWDAVRRCEAACAGNACTGECTPNDTQCFSDTQVQSCNDLGQWQTPASCPLACVGDDCGGECVPGDRRCSGSGLPQLCEEGSWSNEPACDFVCVGRGSCGGECVPGDQRCNPASGVPQRCSPDGSWQNQTPCQFVCSGNGQCSGECSPGSRRCDPASGLPQQCSGAGQWQNDGSCPFVCSGNGQCTGECEPGDRRCSPTSGQPQECSAAGRWQNDGSCPFVCSGGFCTGECTPGSRRCNGATGVPQLCSAAGQFQNQAACASGSSCSAGQCLCNSGLATCGNACVDLDDDPANCGACGRSCQGGACVAGECQPVRIATGQNRPGSVLLTNTHVYWIDTGSSDTLAAIRRVPKGGGTIQTVISGQGRMTGFAIGGNQIYFAADDRRTATSAQQIRRANLDGTNLQNFSPDDPDGVSGVFIDGGFVYYRTIIGINASNEIYRSPLLSQGQSGVSSHTLFATVQGPILSMAAAGGCFWFVRQDAPAELMRKCSPAAAAARRYLGAGRVNLRDHAGSDATHIYFRDVSRGMLRMPLNSTTFEVLVSGTTTTAPQAGLPTVDDNALYYFSQTGSLTAPACTTAHTLFRAGKTIATATPVEILPPPHACPTQVAVDATTLYWSTAEGNEVFKLTK